MSFQISDCTIRDGGYLTNKLFPEKFVHGIVDGLVRAGIDYVETGFLQRQVNGEPIVYHDSKGVRKFIPKIKGNSEFVGFCDNSRYDIDCLDVCDHKAFGSLRISFAKHEWKEAIEFCIHAKEKGYNVFVQPMDAPGYSMKEREELINEVNRFKPTAFSIVDTFGTMHLHDLVSIFEHVDALLAPEIKVGLHSHNNLNLSVALVETLCNIADETGRDVAVDGSLYGMGRGAGNANTEVVANYLNVRYGKKYNIPVLIETIEKWIIPLCGSVKWGYDMPMFICGSQKSHVDNVYYLSQIHKCSYNELYDIIGSIELDKRKRYGKGYSKGNFDILEEAYQEYMSKK